MAYGLLPHEAVIATSHIFFTMAMVR